MADTIAPAPPAAPVAPDPTSALITRALAHILPAGQVAELRAPKAKVGRDNSGRDILATMSGYFNSSVNLVAESKTFNAPGVFFTLNPVDPRLLARCNNRVVRSTRGDASTADADILCRRWLFVEADANRPSGICATDGEKAEAQTVADAVLTHLRAEGWPEPMQIDSGNGYYLLYRVDLPTNDGGISTRCLKALAARFDTAAAHVDIKVGNPGRIIRLPGSWNKKGDSTPDRPHRKCVPLAVPDEMVAVPVELLEALAGTAPVVEKRATSAGVGGSSSGEFKHRLLVPEYLSSVGVEVLGTGTGNEGQDKWWVVCPFNSEHRGKDAYVMQYETGAVGFHCSHNSCSSNKWSEFKDAVGDPEWHHYNPPMLAEGMASPDGGVPVRLDSLGDLAKLPDSDPPPPMSPPVPPPNSSRDGESGTAGSDTVPDATPTPNGASPPPRPNSFQLEMRRNRRRGNTSPIAFICGEARQRFELFCAPNGLAYASPDKVTAFPIEGSTRFSDQLYRIHRELISPTEPAESAMIANAVKALAAEARLNCVRPVLQRSGWHDGKAYVYRADPTAPNQVLVISRDGVSSTAEPPMRFAVRTDAAPIPAPAVVGDIEALRPFLNLENPDQFPIVAAWIAAAVAVSLPVRLLMITGDKGTAKSTFAELILRLVDPHLLPESNMPEEPLRGIPKDEEALALSALHSHTLVADNLSGLNGNMSDLFCRVVTGGMFATRTKYTTTDETRIYLRRPVILTGIDMPTLRSDLLDRMLTVPLKKIEDSKRRTKRGLFERFDAARPTILAGLYQLIIRGLDTSISLGDMCLSRMADFDEFAARAVGRGTVEKEMAEVDFDNAATSLEGYHFLPTLLKFLSTRPRWRGTAGDLWQCLESEYKEANSMRPIPNNWPQAPHVLSGKMKKAAPELLKVHGIRVTTEKDTDRKRTKYLVIDNPSATAKRPHEASDSRTRATGERSFERDDLFV